MQRGLNTHQVITGALAGRARATKAVMSSFQGGGIDAECSRCGEAGVVSLNDFHILECGVCGNKP